MRFDGKSAALPARQLSKAEPRRALKGIRPGSLQVENPYVAISPLWSQLTFMVIVAFLFLLYVSAAFNPRFDSQAVVRLAVVTIYVMVSTSPLWARWKGIGFFHPLYIISAMGFMRSTLASSNTWVYGTRFHPALPSASYSQLATLEIVVLMLMTLSWVCILIGFRSTVGMKWSFVRFSDNPKILGAASVACLVIGIYCLAQLIGLSGGLELHLKNITRGHASKIWVGDAEYASIYAILSKLTIIAPALWILLGKKPFLQPALWGLIALSLASAFLINGRRTDLLIATVVLTSCWILRRGSMPLGRVSIIVLFLFIMVGVIGEFRHSNWKQSSINFSAIENTSIQDAIYKSLEELESRRGAGAVYAIVARVPKDEPFLIGRNYINYFRRFVPRIIWKDKPRGIGIDCAEIFYGRIDSGGIPPGGLGEAYWSGGVLGIILVYLLWGLMLKNIGQFYVRHRTSATATLFYLATLGTLGPSEPQFRAWLYLVMPVAIILLTVGVIKIGGAKR